MKDFEVFTDEEINEQIDRFEEQEYKISELERIICEQENELKLLRQMKKYLRWTVLSFLIALLSFAFS